MVEVSLNSMPYNLKSQHVYYIYPRMWQVCVWGALGMWCWGTGALVSWKRKLKLLVFAHTDQLFLNTNTWTPEENFTTHVEPGPQGKLALPVSHGSKALESLIGSCPLSAIHRIS